MRRTRGIAVLNGGFFSKIGVSLLLALQVLLLLASPVLAVLEGNDETARTGELTAGREGMIFPTSVTEDGYVSEGYDVFVWCGNVSAGVDDESVRAEFEGSLRAVEEGALEGSEAPSEGEIRTRMEEESAQQVKACREAGFRTADDVTTQAGSAPAPQGALPDTGGAPIASLPAAGLLLASLGVTG